MEERFNFYGYIKDMIQSIADQLSDVLSPLSRKLTDENVKHLGTGVQCLRITLSEKDVMGDQDQTIESSIIENVIIKHPFASRVRLFGNYDDQSNTFNSTAMDLMEFLPIEIKIPFNGDSEEIPVSLKKGDLLVECLRDEHGNKIPFIMEVSRLFGSFSMKNIIGKTYESTIFRGSLDSSIKQIITDYINSIV